MTTLSTISTVNTLNITDSPYKIKRKRSKYASFMKAYRVRTPKYKFYVECGGDATAPVVLLIMGLGAQFLVWPNEFCQHLIDAGFQVVRFDNRDCGKSSKFKHKNALTTQHLTLTRQLKLLAQFKLGVKLPSLGRYYRRIYDESATHELPIPYYLTDMAEDTYHLLNALQIERCHIIGMSMGGMIAQIIAAEHPERVISLGLLSTSNNRLLLPVPSVKTLRNLMRTAPPKQDVEAVIAHNVALLKTISSAQYFDDKSAYDKARVLYDRRFYPKGVTRHLLAILATGSLRPYNARTKAPTLIVHGSRDRLLSATHGRELARAIPNAKFELIKGLGHDIPVELVAEISRLFVEHFNEAQSLVES